MKSEIIKELKEHIPFTFSASLIAVMLVVINFIINKEGFVSLTGMFFEFLHPAHLFFSSMVSAAIFFKYKKNIVLSLIIGSLISLIVGSVSDIIFPYIGGNILKMNLSFHLPLIEMPLIILATALIGAVFGVMWNITKLPHFVHVFISVFASLFYLIAFSQSFSFVFLVYSVFLVFLSVIIPCCLGDIVFPLMIKRGKNGI